MMTKAQSGQLRLLERRRMRLPDAELKVLHRTIKKIEEDTERFSFNTAVSTFMICVNELADLKCHKKEILEKLLILLTPYAPHIAEELWSQLGNEGSVLDASYPAFQSGIAGGEYKRISGFHQW